MKTLLLAILLLCLPLSGVVAVSAAQAPLTLLRLEAGRYSVGEALELLLQTTGSRLYLLDPPDLKRRTETLIGSPAELLRTLLRSHSYATIAAGNLPPGIYLSSSMASDSAPATGREASDSDSSSTPARAATSPTQPSPAASVQRPQRPRTTAATEQRPPVVSGAAVAQPRPAAQASAPLAAVEPAAQKTAPLVETSAQDLAPLAETSVQDLATFAETPAAEQTREQLWAEEMQLSKRIERLEEYIESGAAKKWFDKWASIKDPKYLYNPWNELTQLKARYDRL